MIDQCLNKLVGRLEDSFLYLKFHLFFTVFRVSVVSLVALIFYVGKYNMKQACYCSAGGNNSNAVG